MKKNNTLTLLIALLPCLACVVGAILLAMAGDTAWPWFLAVSVLLGQVKVS